MEVGSTALTTWAQDYWLIKQEMWQEASWEGRGGREGREVREKREGCCTGIGSNGVSQLGESLSLWQLHQFTSSFSNSRHKRRSPLHTYTHTHTYTFIIVFTPYRLQ